MSVYNSERVNKIRDLRAKTGMGLKETVDFLDQHPKATVDELYDLYRTMGRAIAEYKAIPNYGPPGANIQPVKHRWLYVAVGGVMTESLSHQELTFMRNGMALLLSEFARERGQAVAEARAIEADMGKTLAKIDKLLELTEVDRG